MDSKKILCFLLPKRVISLWNELEAQYAPHPCENLEALLSAIKSNAHYTDANFEDELKKQKELNQRLQAENEILQKDLLNSTEKSVTLDNKIKELSNSLADLSARHKSTTINLLSSLVSIEQNVQFYDDKISTAVLNNCYRLLEACGIELRMNGNGIFDPSYQEIIDTVGTNNIDLDGQVAQSIEVGLIYEGACLRVQKVIVYKYNL